MVNAQTCEGTLSVAAKMLFGINTSDAECLSDSGIITGKKKEACYGVPHP